MRSVARAEARIKQLCCLGLDSEIIVPALLNELHEAIPAAGMSFFWLGPHIEITNIYDEHPDMVHKIAPLYLTEFLGKARERNITRSPTESARLDHGVVGNAEVLKVSANAFIHSDFYNLLLRPLGYGNMLRLVLREAGIAKAALHVHRPLKGPDFTSTHRRCLAQLAPFITHALTPGPQDDTQSGPLVDSGENGMIVVNRDGRLISFSTTAHRLLILATNLRIQSMRSIRPQKLPPAVVALCRNLTEVHAGKPDTSAPVIRHRNIWGQFTFRAYWLDSAALGEGHIGITVTREEPLPLRLWRGTRGLPLSRRQSEVALLLAQGHTYADIARRLDITRNTAITHSRWVYNKLNVHNTTALRNKLLSNAANP